MIDHDFITPDGRKIRVKATILYTMPGYNIIKFTNPLTKLDEEAVVVK